MNKRVRPPAVAGVFYPGSAPMLTAEVNYLLEESSVLQGLDRHNPPKAMIAPHAGYLYSGPIAASVYALLALFKNEIRRVIILGPTHRFTVNGIATPSYREFSTPLGNIPVDTEALNTLKQFPFVHENDQPHQGEHSIEVHLPFLQHLIGSFSLVPLVVGRASAFDIAEVIESLWGDNETLFISSSDLSHYLCYEEARLVDEGTAQRILQCSPTIHHYQACGATPINGLLLAARKKRLISTQIDLRNSGDTAGDKNRVVGYGAFAFWPPDNQHSRSLQ